MNTPETPQKPEEGLYYRTPHAPEDLFQALSRLRQEASDEIERLLLLIDRIDGDVDLEPSLTGFSDGMDDREGDAADDEPSLAGITVDPCFADVCNFDFDCECNDGDDEDGGDSEEETDSGIGDYDGLMEQCPQMFAHCDVRVEQ